MTRQALGGERGQDHGRDEHAELGIETVDRVLGRVDHDELVGVLAAELLDAVVEGAALVLALEEEHGDAGLHELERAVEEVGARDGAGAHPLHLLEDAHGEQHGLAPEGAGADEDVVGLVRVGAGDLLGAGIEALPDLQQVIEDVLGLRDVGVVVGEVAAAVEQAQREDVEHVVAEVAAAGDRRGRNHRGGELAERGIRLGEGHDLDAGVDHLLDGGDDLLGVTGGGGGDHNGILVEVLVAEHVELGGVHQKGVELGSVLVDEVDLRAKLVVGSAHAQVDQVGVAAIMELVGDRLDLGGLGDDGGAVSEVPLDIHLGQRNLLFDHGYLPSCLATLTGRRTGLAPSSASREDIR